KRAARGARKFYTTRKGSGLPRLFFFAGSAFCATDRRLCFAALAAPGAGQFPLAALAFAPADPRAHGQGDGPVKQRTVDVIMRCQTEPRKAAKSALVLVDVPYFFARL